LPQPRTETCRFSGLKIYPGKVRQLRVWDSGVCWLAWPGRTSHSRVASQGIKLARTDGQVLLFLNSKCKRLYNQKLKASKLAWTALYRKAHKKDQSTEAARRKKRSTKVTISRSIGSASLELIQKRRNEKSDVRAAARENALREIKERAKRLKEEKAKVKTTTAAAKPKQAAAPKLSLIHI
jgi:large subunit ribosomal protein L24e